MAGDRQRRQRGDLVSPAEGVVEVAEALHEPDAGGVLTAVGLGRRAASRGSARPRRGATGAGSSSGRPSGPSLAAGIPKRAAGVATRRSQATASCVPAPRAAPSTAAMSGRGSSRSAPRTLRSRSVKPVSSTPERSAPAQKCPPAPVITTTRASTDRRWASSSCSKASWSSALRRSWRSIVSSATGPRSSRWITAAS